MGNFVSRYIKGDRPGAVADIVVPGPLEEFRGVAPGWPHIVPNEDGG